MQNTPPRGGGRETRLLLVTIAVSVATLLLLARFRFPDEGPARTDVAPAPLERLAARATFDELASIMADLERRIAPAITVLAVRADTPAAAYLPAPRLTDDRAVALVGRDEQIFSVDSDEAPPILGRDAAHNLVVVQVPSQPDSALPVRTGAVRQGPRYLAVVEATRQGPAIRPVYVGRTDILQDPRGAGALLSVGAAQQTLSRGSAVFSLDGTFIGLATDVSGVITIVPGEMLRKIAEEAQGAIPVRGDLGIDVQTLTPALAKAARAPAGVIVSYVDPAGPSAGVLQPGDVVQSIDGTAVATVAAFQQIAQTRPPGTAAALGIVRRGSAATIRVTATAPRRSGAAASDGLGALLRDVPGVGVEILAITSDSPAARAGLQRGDIVTWVDGRSAPDEETIARSFRALETGAAMLLTVQRATQHRVIAVEKR